MSHNKRTQYDLMHPLFKAMESMSSSDLSSHQRILLLGLFRFMDGNGVCYPSYNSIHKTTGLTRNTIAANIKKLVTLGWLTYVPGDKSKSQANTYYLNLERLGLLDSSLPSTPCGFIAPDGSRWDCASDYWRARQSH